MLKKLKKKSPALYFIVIGIAIVAFWRGIWGILDLYLFPNDELLSYLTSIGISLFVLAFNGSNLAELD